MRYNMNNKMRRMPVMLFAMFLSLATQAQDLVVYHVAGNVESVKNGKARPVAIKDVLQPNSTINVPYEGVIELLDEKGAKRYTIRTVGKGTIQELTSSKGSCVLSLTQNYVTYVKNQLRNSSNVVQAQKYTDFATVTREKQEVAKKNDPKSLFDDFKKKANDEFNDFRSKANSEYSDFVRHAWEEFTAFSGIPKPEEVKIVPVVYDESQATDKIKLAKWVKKVFVSKIDSLIIKPLTKKDYSSKPQPIAEIKPVTIPVEEQKFAEMPFTYYGTDMSIHLDETKRFNLGGASREQIASALDMLAKKQYDNAIRDCLNLRSKYELCDWAYLNMLITIGEQFCGPQSNEATLLSGFLFSQSGYKMRYATDGKKLYMLVACKQRIYGKNYFMLDGEDFYPVGNSTMPDRINICPAKFSNEKSLSLVITPQQLFTYQSTADRTIEDEFNKGVKVNVSVNKNMIDFYYDYPAFAPSEDKYARWLSYANTPLDKPVADQVYPQIRELVKGLAPRKAVERILQWIQYGIPYAYDTDVWGGDRVFFAEETLYYPGSDCEDRAILFTRIVRDVLHMPCVLVYYPGHLAAAVHFNEQVRGDRFQLEDTDYVVCDPTYIGAEVGMSMPGMDADQARLIILE